MSTALVFGANGISGIALLREISSSSPSQWKRVIALSRRPPLLEHLDPRITFKSVDLLDDSQALKNELEEAGAREVTHVFFYAYVAKEDEGELIEVNRKLFANAIEAVRGVCKGIQVFSLQTGYKYYGTHLGGQNLAPYPWKEDAKRHEGSNFYFVQEDMLRKAAKENGWKWIITRPNFIIGTSKGNFMSIAVTLALYAVARKALGEPLVFPGSSISYNLEYDQSTASNNAAFQLYAALKPEAGNRVFNIHDGRPVKLEEVWTRTAQYFDLPLASPPADDPPNTSKKGSDLITMHSVAQWAESNKSKLTNIARDLQMDSEVFQYATWDFIDFATSRTWNDVATMDEARSIGWKGTVHTWEDGYRSVYEDLKDLGIIPK